MEQELTAVFSLIGVAVGAMMKIVADYIAQSQAAAIAILKVHHERILADRYDRGIDRCRIWAVESLEMLERRRYREYRDGETKIEEAACAAIRLDRVYGRNWKAVIQTTSQTLRNLADHEAEPRREEDRTQAIKLVARWLSELEWYGDRQLRAPNAGFVRLRGWALVARLRFGKR